MAASGWILALKFRDHPWQSRPGVPGASRSSATKRCERKEKFRRCEWIHRPILRSWNVADGTGARVAWRLVGSLTKADRIWRVLDGESPPADGKPGEKIINGRLFATRRKTGGGGRGRKRIFEVSEHNLEEGGSWLEFSIGRQKCGRWPTRRAKSGCWRIANRRERSRYSHAIISQRGQESQ